MGSRLVVAGVKEGKNRTGVRDKIQRYKELLQLKHKMTHFLKKMDKKSELTL